MKNMGEELHGVTISKKENCAFRHKITGTLYVKEPVINVANLLLNLFIMT